MQKIKLGLGIFLAFYGAGLYAIVDPLVMRCYKEKRGTFKECMENPHRGTSAEHNIFGTWNFGAGSSYQKPESKDNDKQESPNNNQ